MISLDNLKHLVLKNIEDTGYMNQIRAQLKLQVYKVKDPQIFEIIENQDEGTKQQNGFKWQHPLTSQLQSMDHGVNSLELMIEYLEFFKLDYTAQVLRKEANMNDIIIRESLGNRIGLQGKQDSMRPLLIIILGEFLKAVTEGYSPLKKSEGGCKYFQYRVQKQEKKTESVQQIVKPIVIKEAVVKQTLDVPKPVQQAKQIEKDKNVKEQSRPQTAPPVQPIKEPPSAVNKIRGAKQGTGTNLSNLYGFDMNASSGQNIITPYDDLMVTSPPQNDPYAFDLDAKTSADPYAFDLNGPQPKGKKKNPYDFDLEEDVHEKKQNITKNNKFNSNVNSNSNMYDYDVSNGKSKKQTKGKQVVEEDIDDFTESRDDKKQSNGMFTSSEDMMRATQSMGVDESVDSLALEDYDYYEDVTKKR